jgi:pimeloyl-ACP methyl ester carboxylesterase
MGLWGTVGNELSALGKIALSMPLRPLLARECFDPGVPHPTPVVLVHGLLGDPTNFNGLRSFLTDRGIGNFASFSYRPRIDYQNLAPLLGETIEAVCRESGTPSVDVVGHSLGGLIARYLIELGDGTRVRRLVTLGSPYYSDRRPPRELAVFAACDPLVPVPGRTRGRMRVIEDCGHWNLLYHPTVFRVVARFLGGDAASSLRSLDVRDAA